MAMIGHHAAGREHPNDPDRGTGRTTEQMKAAPKGAIYIWPALGSMGYARHLAQNLGRDDLVIKMVAVLDKPEQFYGRRDLNVVIDHACYDVPGALTDRRAATLDMLAPLMGRG